MQFALAARESGTALVQPRTSNVVSLPARLTLNTTRLQHANAQRDRNRQQMPPPPQQTPRPLFRPRAQQPPFPQQNQPGMHPRSQQQIPFGQRFPMKGPNSPQTPTPGATTAPKRGPSPLFSGEGRVWLRSKPRKVLIPKTISTKQLSSLLRSSTVDLLKTLIKMGEKPQSSMEILNPDLVEILASEYNAVVVRPVEDNDDEKRTLPPTDEAALAALPKRAPIVAIMGHINHGKTSLLDAFRNSRIVDTEAGRITQKMGAFEAQLESGAKITFLDTPGHQAFSAMRARGTQCVDMAILIVAGDEGVQEQTVEAIVQIQSANIPFIVAMNKKDKHKFDSHAVALQLLRHGIQVESLGGEVPSVDISAITKDGLDTLEDAIMLQAEEMNLRASTSGRGEAVIIDANKRQGLGFVATAIVRWGTVKVGDLFVVGTTTGKVKSMVNSNGVSVKEAGPGSTVEIIGFKSLAQPGQDLLVVPTEKRARDVANYRSSIRSDEIGEKAVAKYLEDLRLRKEEELAKAIASLEGKEIAETDTNAAKPSKPEVRFIIRADVAGSVEAIENGLAALPQDEVGVRILSKGVGSLTETDVTTALESKAVLIAFNVKVQNSIMDLIEIKKLKLFKNNIIYGIFDDVRAHISTMLPPRTEIDIIGEAEVQQVFHLTVRKGVTVPVAGCRVLRGSIQRNSVIRVMRQGAVVFDTGKVSSLMHHKEAVKEARVDTDCGVQLEKFSQYEPGDILQSIKIRSIPRQLGEAQSVITKNSKEAPSQKRK